MIKKMLRLIDEQGLKKAIQYCVLKTLGISNLQEEINTLNYFLNEYILDISKVGETKDADLLILQRCDTLLIAILDKVCNYYGISFWLDYGTLLGAVRHNGFVPWDDDVDLCTTRDEYETFMKNVSPVLIKNGIDVSVDSWRIGIGYKHKKTGVWIDLTFVDDFYSELPYEKTRKAIIKKIKKYKRKYNLNKTITSQEYQRRKAKFFGVNQIGHRFVYRCCEVPFESVEQKVFDSEDIFPLKKYKFSSYVFNVPNNTEKYIKQAYGKDYMSFPKRGVEHHGNEEGILKTWAKNSNTDMNEIYNELQNILKNIS